MRYVVLFLLVLLVVGGVYAYKTGMISVSKTSDKTLIEVDTNRMEKGMRDSVNKLEDLVAPNNQAPIRD